MPRPAPRSTLFERAPRSSSALRLVLTLSVSVVSASAASACASTTEPSITMPRSVYIPTGWLGRAKSSEATSATTQASTDAQPASPDPGTEPEPTHQGPTVVELASTQPRSGPLRDPSKAWFNPLPKGVFAGYVGDTGLDIASPPRPVYAIAAGTLDYSEPGHTRWVGKTDTPNSIRIELDVPIAWKGRRITHLYYTHLSALSVVQAEGSTTRHHVQAGEQIGVSGQANGLPHLHLGMLLDDDVDQAAWGTFLLEGEIRAVLGGYKNGDMLPKLPAPDPQ